MVEPTNHPARDEWERMLSGELYVADSPQQQEANMRRVARQLPQIVADRADIRPSPGAGHQHVRI